MIHNLGHRTEDSVKRPYGNTWNLANPTTAWDKFTANYLESPAGTYGIGSCEVPANNRHRTSEPCMDCADRLRRL